MPALKRNDHLNSMKKTDSVWISTGRPKCGEHFTRNEPNVYASKWRLNMKWDRQNDPMLLGTARMLFLSAIVFRFVNAFFMHFEYSKTSKQLTQNTNEFRVNRLRSIKTWNYMETSFQNGKWHQLINGEMLIEPMWSTEDSRLPLIQLSVYIYSFGPSQSLLKRFIKTKLNSKSWWMLFVYCPPVFEHIRTDIKNRANAIFCWCENGKVL